MIGRKQERVTGNNTRIKGYPLAIIIIGIATNRVYFQRLHHHVVIIIIKYENNVSFSAMWVKATKQEVCVHTSRNAELYSPLTGGILSVRLIHTRGTITCDKNARSCGVMWGCACVQRQQADRRLDIIITDHNSNIVFPDMKSPGKLYLTTPENKDV